MASGICSFSQFSALLIALNAIRLTHILAWNALVDLLGLAPLVFPPALMDSLTIMAIALLALWAAKPAQDSALISALHALEAMAIFPPNVIFPALKEHFLAVMFAITAIPIAPLAQAQRALPAPLVKVDMGSMGQLAIPLAPLVLY